MKFQREMNARWRSELFKICVLFAAFGTIAEIGIYWYDASHRSLFLPPLFYRFRFLYIPAALNFLVLVLTYACLKGRRLSDSAKNACACLLIYFLCANTQVIHYVYGPLLMLPAVAIFMTVLFANPHITNGIFAASLASLALAWWQAAHELRKGDPYLTTDALLAALVMLVTYLAARLLIRYVSEQLHYILASNQRQQQLIEECNMDPLVGIGNRRALSQRMEQLLHAPGEKKCYMLMMDIDEFKAINDSYGHICGDKALIELGAKIKGCADEPGIWGFRYGGDEFVLLFEGFEKEEVCLRAERLQNFFSIPAMDASHPGQTITISGSIIELSPEWDAEACIEKGDRALYTAKADGKHQIFMG